MAGFRGAMAAAMSLLAALLMLAMAMPVIAQDLGIEPVPGAGVLILVRAPGVEPGSYNYTCMDGTMVTLRMAPGENFTVSVSVQGSPPQEDYKCVVSWLEAQGQEWLVPIVSHALTGKVPVVVGLGVEAGQEYTPLPTVTTDTTPPEGIAATGIEESGASYTTIPLSGEAGTPVGTQPVGAGVGVGGEGVGIDARRLGLIVGVALITGAAASLVARRGSW